MMRDLSRRRVLQSTALAVGLGVAGCSTEVDEKEARVVGRQPAELSEEEAGTDPIQVEVLVHNIGIATDVEITLEAVDNDQGGEGVVATVTETFSFDGDEQRSVFVEITPGPTANIIFAEARTV